MFASLSKNARDSAQFESPVTAISLDEQGHMRISVNRVESRRRYSAVISTVPLPRLSLMDLTGVDINNNYAQWSAIRELQYCATIKIGVKFNTPWWETELPAPIHGGQSFTDLPLRTM
jgi:monoamine oxidase